MTDLIKRLKWAVSFKANPVPVCMLMGEAIDEMERLREALLEIATHPNHYMGSEMQKIARHALAETTEEKKNG